MGGHPQPHTHTSNSPCIHLAYARFFQVSEFGFMLCDLLGWTFSFFRNYGTRLALYRNLERHTFRNDDRVAPLASACVCVCSACIWREYHLKHTPWHTQPNPNTNLQARKIKKNTGRQAGRQTGTRACTRACTRTCTHARTHARTRTRTHACTHAHMHARAYACMHAH